MQNPPNLRKEVTVSDLTSDACEKDHDLYEGEVQCPCGRIIRSPKEYRVFFMREIGNVVYLLCPNERCYVGELGNITFSIHGRSAKVDRAFFNMLFYSWNSEQLGEKTAKILLEDHLKTIVTRDINWQTISETAKRKKR